MPKHKVRMLVATENNEEQDRTGKENHTMAK